MSTTIIKGVELLAVGNWTPVKGKGDITADDLKSIVAAYKNRMSDKIPIKIGHSDERFQDKAGNPPKTGDGDPAYGWVENIAVSADGKKLIGDYVGVPQKLAAALPSAYRRRSVELVRGQRIDGTVYPIRLTGLALLGQTDPAVKDLADALAFYGVEITTGETTVIDLDDTQPIPPGQVHAADGGPVSTTTQTRLEGAPTVPPLTPALRTALGLTDASTEAEITAALTAAGLTAVAPADPAAPAVPAATPVASAPLAAVPAAPAPAPAAAAPAAAPAAPEAIAASAGGLTTTIDTVMLSELQADAAAGREAREQQVKERRDGLIRTALSAGKIHPVTAVQYRTMLDTDEAGVTTLLAQLPAVLPVTEIGHAGQAAQYGSRTADQQKAYEDAVLSDYS